MVVKVLGVSRYQVVLLFLRKTSIGFASYTDPALCRRSLLFEYYNLTAFCRLRVAFQQILNVVDLVVVDQHNP